MRFVPALATAWLLSFCGAASGQVTLFEHENFGGRSIDLFDPAPDLGNSGMNDRVSSIAVRGGAWQFCEHSNFGGRCVTLSRGDYPSLAAMGMNDAISSARPVGGAAHPAPAPTAARIVLYDGYEFSGASAVFDQGIASLDRTGFNDRAVSAIVYEGIWELCEHANFGGDCVRLGPGRHPDLGKVSGRASSLRVVGAAGPPVAVAPPQYAPAPQYAPPSQYVPPPAYGPPPGAVRVVLYSGPNFTGRQLVVDRNRIRNLEEVGFNDRARSLRVERGYWMFCSDAEYDGECRTFGPGDYPSLPGALSGRISSGRRISEDYPYGSPPNWGPR